MDKQRKLVMENGLEMVGTGFGAAADTIHEIVFNTAMAGYQEIVTDPDSTDATVVMTYPLIGNYGITDEDNESRTPTIGGLIVREYNDFPSNFRYTKTLSEILEENGIPGLQGVDTRKLTRIIRDEGPQKVLITDADTPHEEAMARIQAYTCPTDAVARVSCKKKWYARTANHRFNVVAVDCGIKTNIIRKLNEAGCNVTVVPYNTPAETILSFAPDGVLISNGPGNPEDAVPVLETVKALKGKVPMFGIDLGLLIIALAYGAKVYKLHCGHRGGNHPVKNMLSGKIEITSQGQAYAVKADSLRGTSLYMTHQDLTDQTVQGIACDEDQVFAVQFHPESAPGPQDSAYLFNQFISMMARRNK